ncbi:MAG TPA: enoyl-CoA hydratase [Burkholderiales bacterium]|jgi:enoyl-CoA hydratase/carnithine racemase|nr:enoyl-CoA hydratase [Burkholderiales bacterium]
MSAVLQASNEPVLLRRDAGGIATVTLNRPKQYNALSEELLTELQSSLDSIEKDPTVRVVVIAGSGTAFCAGHDLKQMRANPKKAYYEKLFAQCSKVMMTLSRLPQPVIARVHGIATAAGCQLVAQCDLAVASDNARFAVSGINVALFCSTPSVPLARNISRKQAMEMLLTGDFIDATTAKARGLVNRVVPIEKLDAEVKALADAIIAKSSVAVTTGKKMFYKQIEMGMGAAYEYASEVMACNMMAEDVGEGIDAFTQKRAPNWKGR